MATTARGAAVCAVALLAALPVAASAWELLPRLEIGAAYTDNIQLAPAGAEASESVLWARPDFTLQEDGERLDLSARYALDAYLYGGDDSSVFHQFYGALQSELLKDLFFLNATASRSQALQDPEGTYSFGTLPFNGNRVDADRWDVNPYLSKAFGNKAEIYASYLYGQLKYDDPAIQESDRHYARASLGNWSKESGLTLRLNYDLNRVEYQFSDAFEYQKAYAEVGIWAMSSLRLFGTYGKESDFFDPSSKDMTEQSWYAGLEYVPSPRTYLRLAGGDRPWGNSYQFSFQYTLRRGSLDMGYSEEPYTPGLDGFSQRPFPEDENIEGPLDETIDRPGAAGRYLRKHSHLTLGYELPKSQWSLRLYQTRREDIIPDGESVAITGEEDDRGATLAWTWDAGTRTTLRVYGNYSRRAYASSDLEEDIWRLGASAGYELGAKTSLLFSLQHARQDRGSSASGYEANTASLWLRRDF